MPTVVPKANVPRELLRYCRSEITWKDTQRWLCKIEKTRNVKSIYVTDFPADRIGAFGGVFKDPDDRVKCEEITANCQGQIYLIPNYLNSGQVLAQTPFLTHCGAEVCVLEQFGSIQSYKIPDPSMFEELLRVDSGATASITRLGAYCLTTTQSEVAQKQLFTKITTVKEAVFLRDMPRIETSTNMSQSNPLAKFNCNTDQDCFRTKKGGCAVKGMAEVMPNGIDLGPATTFTCRCVIDGPMRGCARQN